jgi:site-specific DNA recombinase
MKKCFIYVRVSTEEQLKGFSVQDQLERCRNYARGKNYLISREFIEPFTGTEYYRPQMDAMKEALKAGEAEVVLVMNISRWARNTLYSLALEKEVTDLGAEVVYTETPYAKTAEGTLLKHIQASLAEYEREKILERMSSAKRQRAKTGQPMPGRWDPYGYHYVGARKSGSFVVVEEEAAIVRQIFDWCIYEKMPTNAIAKRLTKMGVLTRGDMAGLKRRFHRGVWGRTSVWTILTNAMYKGEYWWGSPDPILIPVPAIIAPELWAAAQVQLADNKQTARRNTRFEYLMQTRMYCKDCGRLFYCHEQGTDTGALTGYYRCGGQYRKWNPDGLTAMCKRSLRSVDVDRVVWEKLRQTIRDPDRLRQFMDPGVDDTERALVMQGLERIEADLGDADKRQLRLIDLYTNEDLDQAALKEAASKLKSERAELRKRRKGLEERLSVLVQSASRYSQVQDFVDILIKRIDNMDFEGMRQTVLVLDVYGVVTRGATPDDDEIRLVTGKPVV